MNPATGLTGIPEADAIFSRHRYPNRVVCRCPGQYGDMIRFGCQRCEMRAEIEREENARVDAEIDRRLEIRRQKK